MKKSRLLFMFILVVALNTSCEKQTDEPVKTISSQEMELDKFGELLSDNMTLNLKIVDETHLERKLKPLVDQSRSLLKSYGLSDLEINELFVDPNDPRIGIAGILIYSRERSHVIQTAGFVLAFNKQWECIAEAVGVPAALVAGNMKKLTVKAMLRSVAKISGRFLGYVGLAWAIADYTSCMGYW